MNAVLLLGVSAFFLCLVLTPLCRSLAIRFNWVDKPDQFRKLHRGDTPRVGGVAIVAAYLGALGIGYVLGPYGARFHVQHHALLWALLPGTAVIFITGLIDDRITLKPKQKLLGQIIAACIAVSFGARLQWSHGPSWLAALLSVIWLLACTNAVNLIDGMDGLATGMGLMATLTTLVVALVTGNHGLALATAPLAGCLLAFLRYNFAPASIFLGDCGSLTIGFVLGCLGLIWSRGSGMLGMVAPFMTLALPLIDVALAIGRRFLRSTPITAGDRSHVHHRVLAMGFSTRTAALILYAFCAISAVLALIESFGKKEMGWAVLLVFFVLVLVGISRLKYIEFQAARRTFSTKRFRRAVEEEIYLEEMSRALKESTTVEECWTVMQKACKDMEFATVKMEWNGRRFSQQFHSLDQNEPACSINLSFGNSGKLQVTGMPQTAPTKIMTVLHHVQVAMVHRSALLMEPDLNLERAA